MRSNHLTLDGSPPPHSLCLPRWTNARRPATRLQLLRLPGSRRPPPSLIFSPGNTDEEARKMSRYRPALRRVRCKLFIGGGGESLCLPVVGFCLRRLPALRACVSFYISAIKYDTAPDWSQLPSPSAPLTAAELLSSVVTTITPVTPPSPGHAANSTRSLRSPASLGSYCNR